VIIEIGIAIGIDIGSIGENLDNDPDPDPDFDCRARWGDDQESETIPISQWAQRAVKEAGARSPIAVNRPGSSRGGWASQSQLQEMSCSFNSSSRAP
jgi:hypothetical protein